MNEAISKQGRKVPACCGANIETAAFRIKTTRRERAVKQQQTSEPARRTANEACAGTAKTRRIAREAELTWHEENMDPKRFVRRTMTSDDVTPL
jgi:hypothetical protein